MPQRIQRTRIPKRGYILADGSAYTGQPVYVGRPGPWGNPFTVAEFGTAAVAVARFEQHLRVRRNPFPGWTDLIEYPADDEIRRALAGRDLACWCPLDQPCHADVLLKLANQ